MMSVSGPSGTRAGTVTMSGTWLPIVPGSAMYSPTKVIGAVWTTRTTKAVGTDEFSTATMMSARGPGKWPTAIAVTVASTGPW